jgi:hypothetical protein
MKCHKFISLFGGVARARTERHSRGLRRGEEEGRADHAVALPRAAYPQCRRSNANSLCGQNSARIVGIRASFQRDNLRRHF